MTLKIVTNELLTKSAVGYSVIDLMRESLLKEMYSSAHGEVAIENIDNGEF